MRIIALVIAAGLMFAGCTESEPKEPKASSTPKATVPSMPPAAQEDSEAGAIAFVKHYIDVFNYASNTGDVKELKKLSDPSCEGCTSYIELYENTYADGGYFKNSDWVLSDAVVESHDGLPVVLGHISAEAGLFRENRDAEAHVGQREDFEATYVPARSDGGWLIRTFGKQEGSAK